MLVNLFPHRSEEIVKVFLSIFPVPPPRIPAVFLSGSVLTYATGNSEMATEDVSSSTLHFPK